MKDLGLRIRAARKLHGYSTEKLGQVSGVSVATIGRAETVILVTILLSKLCFEETIHV